MGDMPGRIIWSLSSSGLGTTIAGAGNSGGYQAPGPPPWTPDFESAIDLRYADDLVLLVNVGAIVTAPSLVVFLDVFDDQGNLHPAVAQTAAITAAGAAGPVYIGKHGGTTGLFVVLPMWGRISWTCTGGSCTGVDISLFAR